MWSSLMLASSGTGYICTFWMHRSKMSGAGETVSEMLNATAMVESPQRRGLLSEEQHPCINGWIIQSKNGLQCLFLNKNVDIQQVVT